VDKSELNSIKLFNDLFEHNFEYYKSIYRLLKEKKKQMSEVKNQTETKIKTSEEERKKET